MTSQFLFKISPKKTFDDLILTRKTQYSCLEVIEEQMHIAFLRSKGAEPRNRILLVGSPGNGKHSLAGAIANKLGRKLLLFSYEKVIKETADETRNILGHLFDDLSDEDCVLLFDNFQIMFENKVIFHIIMDFIECLPAKVVVIASTNVFDVLSDHLKSVFQIILNMHKPNMQSCRDFFDNFMKKSYFDPGCDDLSFAENLCGLSYAELNEFCESLYRTYLLHRRDKNGEYIDMRIVAQSMLYERHYNV